VNWWQSLGARDRAALMIGTAVLLCVLFYLLAWEPLGERGARLEARVAEQRIQLAWMRQASVKLRGQPGTGGIAVTAGGSSLLSTIDQAASRSGLKSAVKRVAPEGDDKVRVWLGEASYRAILSWSETLQRQGIVLETLQMERHADPGRVEARVLLDRAT